MATRRKVPKYAQHLLQPPEKYLEQRLPMLQTTQQQLDEMAPLIICALRKMAKVSPLETTPSLLDIHAHTLKVTPRDIGELKELVGVPARAFKSQPAATAVDAPKLDSRALAKLPEKITVSKLQTEHHETFLQASYALLHGPTDARMLARPAVKAVADAILRAAKNLPVLVAKDLVVCDGDAVQFAGFAVLYFNNVIVEGSGRIILGNQTKLHAYQIKHV